MPTLISAAPPKNWRMSPDLQTSLSQSGTMWTVVKDSDAIVLMLGRPRPSPTQQSRLLMAARLWLYDLAGCNVVQHQLEADGDVLGWLITVNYRNPDREGIAQWLMGNQG